MRYGFLGPVEVWDGDRSVKIGGRQQQRLLAVLLSQPGHVIETHRLVDVLWPDGLAPEAADHSVSTYVHRLRLAIGDRAIVTRGSGYTFDPAAGDLDVDEFEDLVAQARRAGPDAAIALYEGALALWRGRAFGPLGDEWWALATGARLNGLRVLAAEERAASLIATGNRARAVPELQALVLEHPDREQPVCLLAQALHATGRQADALRELAAFRARIAETSGLLPSSEFADLERLVAACEPGSAASSAGRPLRGYVIHDAIGEGGFGRVYAATQPGTNRRVAIKMIRAELADSDEFVFRFEPEARLIARIEHPHIVPLYDYWREPGAAYLVFRLLPRSASSSVVTGGPWSLAHASQLVEEVGGALLAAHVAGVAHGDVRSANVMLDDGGNTYLTDFGIAVAGDEGANLEARVRLDIEDFAVMLWELLAGTSPSPARSHRFALDADRHHRLPSLAARVPGVPDSIDAVLVEATDARPGFASMAEFILAWRAAVGRPEGVVTPVGDATPSRNSARRLQARQLIAAAAAGVNPYRGLRAFSEADAGDYFGRDIVVDALEDALRRWRFVAVVGPSGAGKSSIVHAGLLPRLRRDNARLIATMVPGDRPLDALRDALTEVAVMPIRRRTPAAAIAMVAASAAHGLVLIVDQFEECWTMSSTSERDEFLDGLAAVVSTSASRVRVVAAVRADFYDRPLEHAVIGPLVSEGTFPLPPMKPAELDDAVVLPAARAGVFFDDGVVAAVVADAAASPAALPMMQFTLAELFERRVDGRVTTASLEALGGIAGAVGQRAEQVYGQLDEAGRASAREVFARLVTPGEGAADTRRRARLGELSETAIATADRFVSARLLVRDREAATREPVVEVAHEALLTRWPRLRGWLDEDRRWLAQLQHWAESARSWDAGGRPEGELYRGSRLEAAIESLPVHAGELNEVEVAFVGAGHDARDANLRRERRSTRRLRRMLVAVVVMLVFALLAGGVAVVQRSQARDSARTAEIEALVGRAASLRSTQRDAAALLAAEAFRLSDTPRTRSALLSTFTENAGFLDTHRLPADHDGYVGMVLPDGTHTLITTSDHRIRSYDLATGAVGRSWEQMTKTRLRTSSLTASPDGSLVALIATDEPASGFVTRTIGVFDVTSTKLRFPAIEVPLSIGNATFSPDSRVLVVSGGANETVIAYDATTGHEIGRVVENATGTPDLHIENATGNLDPHQDTAGLAFIGDRRLAVGSVAGRVRIVAVPSMTVVRDIDLPAGTTNHLLPLDGHGFLGNGPGGLVRVDASTVTRRWYVPDRTESCRTDTVIGSLGRLYCADGFGRLVERDLANGRITRHLDTQNGAAGSLAPARGGTELVAFGDAETVVTRWRLDGSGPITRRLAPGYAPSSYSPDGTRLAAAVPSLEANSVGGPDAPYGVIDPATGKVTSDLGGQLFTASWIDNDTLGGATWHPDGSLTTGRYELSTSSFQDDGIRGSPAVHERGALLSTPWGRTPRGRVRGCSIGARKREPPRSGRCPTPPGGGSNPRSRAPGSPPDGPRRATALGWRWRMATSSSTTQRQQRKSLALAGAASSAWSSPARTTWWHGPPAASSRCSTPRRCSPSARCPEARGAWPTCSPMPKSR